MDYATFDNGQWLHTRANYEGLSEAKKAILDEKAGDGSLARRPIVYEGEGPKWTETVEKTRVLRERYTPQEDLADVKVSLCARVDADAGDIRAKYFSQGTGMEMTYQEKFAQANAVDAMGETLANALSAQDAEAQFPVLAASVGIEAETLFECAQLVIGKYADWAGLANVIEKTRLAGKKTINESASVDAANAAYEAITWTV